MGKRGNNEGTITHRKDGRWMARYTVQTATGAKQRAVYGRTRKEAGEKLTKAMADRDGGLVFEGGDQTLSAFLNNWLSGSVKGSVKHSTFESYERIIRCHLKPELGRRKLKALAPDHVQGLYVRKLGAGLDARTRSSSRSTRPAMVSTTLLVSIGLPPCGPGSGVLPTPPGPLLYPTS